MDFRYSHIIMCAAQECIMIQGGGGSSSALLSFTAVRNRGVVSPNNLMGSKNVAI